jgi:hypothetical protein
VGTIRIPEAGYGRFWNFMKTMPGGEFTPDTTTTTNSAAQPTPKKKHGSLAKGTSLKCAVLHAVTDKKPMTAAEAAAFVTGAGFAKSSTSYVLFELTRDKLLKRSPKGYTLTANGSKYRATNCPLP